VKRNSFLAMLSLMLLLSGSLSACSPQASVKDAWQNVKASDSMHEFKFQLKAMRRDVKTLLNPLVRPFLSYPPEPDFHVRYTRAEAPLLQAHLVDALALKNAMESDIRTPLTNMPRTYTHNPRRGAARVFHGQNSVQTVDPLWQEQTVKAWVQTHRFSPNFRTLWMHHPDLKSPMTHQVWWTWIQATLPITGHEAPLSVQKQMRDNPSAELQWRLAEAFPYFPSDAVQITQSKPLSRGEGLVFGLWLAGLEKERRKTSEDAYTEWWASPLADPDARSSLMQDWRALSPSQQHTLNMAYANGVLDAVLNDTPPHAVKGLKRWRIRWNAPLSVKEAIRLMAWAEAKREELS